MMSTNPRNVGKYQLQERLGRGGMGEVWKAFDPQLRRYVAIKFLRVDFQDDAVFMERFQREAQAVASLRHPNIVQIYDAHIPFPSEGDSTESNISYMVMAYIQGHTLADYIRGTSRVGKFPTGAEIVRLFTPISLAIDYAHQKGLIHRDIKPANILLDAHNTERYPMGEPLLTDFGLVKPIGDATGALTHASLGTPLYIAPEQAQGRSGNEQSDIYSLGVILYEMFTGVTPFQGDNPFDIMMQHVNSLPTPPSVVNPNVPPAVNQVILRSLEKEPAKRFATASAMTATLAEALGLPVPESLRSSDYLANSSNNPKSFDGVTMLSTGQAPLQSPYSPSPSALAARTPISEASPQPLSDAATVLASPPSAGVTPPPISPPAPGTMPSKKEAGRSRLSTVQKSLIVLLILVLLGSGLGTLFVLHPWSSGGSSNPVASSVVGHAFFVSGEEIDLTKVPPPGLNDELQIDLQHIPAPATGKAYYAWVVMDNEGGAILLGKLVVNAGSVHFMYTGDHNHTNLLAITNSLLITEGDANKASSLPSLDKQVYHAELSTKPDPNDPEHFSVLDHLRHLLSGEQKLDNVGLHGGLGIWVLRNTAKIAGWAGNARDFWMGNTTNTGYIHGQSVHILDTLEGKQIDPNDGPISRIALIDTPNSEPPDHLTHINNHLDALTRIVGSTQGQQKLAKSIEVALETVKAELEKVNFDVKQLAAMNDQQLKQPQAQMLLNDMQANANLAYLGQVDTATGNVQQKGITQIYTDMQHLATFDVMLSAS